MGIFLAPPEPNPCPYSIMLGGSERYSYGTAKLANRVTCMRASGPRYASQPGWPGCNADRVARYSRAGRVTRSTKKGRFVWCASAVWYTLRRRKACTWMSLCLACVVLVCRAASALSVAGGGAAMATAATQ
eukprot:111111-Prymnesium_polylepis.1